MKLFGKEEKIIDRTINGENLPTLEVVEIASVQYNFLYNQY